MRNIRAFIGVFPPPEIQTRIAALQSTFRQDGSIVRWEPAEKFHVTMKFLGDVRPDLLGQLVDALAQQVSPLRSFNVRLVSAGCFPDYSSPKIVWIGSPDQENPGLVRCFKLIDGTCSAIGWPKEARPFHPHITLGRVKGKISPRLITTIENTTFEPLNFPCNQLLVMKSDLSPSGSTFSVQHTISLNQKE